MSDGQESSIDSIGAESSDGAGATEASAYTADDHPTTPNDEGHPPLGLDGEGSAHGQDGEMDREGEEASYSPTPEHNLEDVFNPRNLTWDELEMLLYEWEPEASQVVNEYFDLTVVQRIRDEDWSDWDQDSEDEEEEAGDAAAEETEGGGDKKGWLATLKEKATGEVKDEDEGGKTLVKLKSKRQAFLNLTSDAAHIVEFYAPWCPHCQQYKWEYVGIAEEVIRRSTTIPVQFHAVSCDVYHAICSTYDIDGFPTIFGWKHGESLDSPGIALNDDGDPDADDVGELLELDLAHEEKGLFNWTFETDEDRESYEKDMKEQAKKAARTKKQWHETKPNTHNDRYHNAALSLSFAIKSQLFQTVTDEGEMDPKRKAALMDFLNLLEWASPQSWQLRTTFVKELQRRISLDAIADRGVVESIIKTDMDRHRSGETEDPWGNVDTTVRSKLVGKILGKPDPVQLAKDDKHWSKTCTHSQPAKGFTCGLWNLFHILTIGASKKDHEMYGFHRGFLVSQHHVAETIKNFIAYFFSCDVCRTNFLNMYDGCGHGHCDRLKQEVLGVAGNDSDRMELALWLWEVHNSVNTRLMKEAATRQNREITHEEKLAALFPTKRMCPGCWLDDDMTKWDNATVFDFLDEWYWPANSAPVDGQFKTIAASPAVASDRDMASRPSARRTKASGPARGSVGAGLLTVLCLGSLALAAFIVSTNRRERRKKFIDSRFVPKKNGYC